MRGGVGGGHRVCDQFVLSSLAAGEVTGGGGMVTRVNIINPLVPGGLGTACAWSSHS